MDEYEEAACRNYSIGSINNWPVTTKVDETTPFFEHRRYDKSA
jgi:hypothetical protein